MTHSQYIQRDKEAAAGFDEVVTKTIAVGKGGD